MADSSIGIKLDGLKALEKGLASLPAAIPTTTSMSINAGLRKMNTEAWRAIKPRYFVARKTVTRGVKMVFANPSRLSGALVGVGKRLYLGRFKFSPSRPGTRERVSVQIGPGISAVVPPSAFVAVMNKQGQGYKGIFMRTGRRRYPITQIRSEIGVPDMLADKPVRTAIEKIGVEEFDKEFKRLTKVKMDAAFKNLPK